MFTPSKLALELQRGFAALPTNLCPSRVPWNANQCERAKRASPERERMRSEG